MLWYLANWSGEGLPRRLRAGEGWLGEACLRAPSFMVPMAV
jgi:hypothetical protein